MRHPCSRPSLKCGVVSILLGGCAHQAGRPALAPAVQANEAAAFPRLALGGDASSSIKSDVPTVAVTPLPAEPRKDCLPPSKGFVTPPIFNKALVITRIAQECKTLSGESGYAPGAVWMVMGVPCTGGGGKVSWEGLIHNANAAHFHFSNVCPMQPPTAAKAEVETSRILGLDAAAKMAAYYPLAIQYWELPDFSDADTGFTVSLRSAAALKDGWRHFRENRSINVRLYGRENLWVKGGSQAFAVSGKIVPGGATRSFRFVLEEIKSLSREDGIAVQQRCEALVPTRNCQELFGTDSAGTGK